MCIGKGGCGRGVMEMISVSVGGEGEGRRAQVQERREGVRVAGAMV